MTKTKTGRSVLAGLLSAVLTAALVLTLAACGNTNASGGTPTESVIGSGDVGTGQTAFTLEVTDADGKTTVLTVRTDEKTVGDALGKEKLITWADGAFGKYIKSVLGMTADYDADGTYWAFYVDGAYAMTGVDATAITPGATYQLKIEK